jgi:hypothetical protein
MPLITSFSISRGVRCMFHRSPFAGLMPIPANDIEAIGD